MSKRLELHEKLCDILGSRHVYFQPPESVKMKYPAIVYERTLLPTKYADDQAYKKDRAYKVIVIDKNPDSELIDKILQLPMCNWLNHYSADNLNHDVFNLYY